MVPGILTLSVSSRTFSSRGEALGGRWHSPLAESGVSAPPVRPSMLSGLGASPPAPLRHRRTRMATARMRITADEGKEGIKKRRERGNKDGDDEDNEGRRGGTKLGEVRFKKKKNKEKVG